MSWTPIDYSLGSSGRLSTSAMGIIIFDMMTHTPEGYVSSTALCSVYLSICVATPGSEIMESTASKNGGINTTAMLSVNTWSLRLEMRIKTMTSHYIVLSLVKPRAIKLSSCIFLSLYEANFNSVCVYFYAYDWT